MGLTDLIASGVEIARSVTADLQDGTVMHQAWIGVDGMGASSYASPVPRTALVRLTADPITSQSGVLVETKAYLAFMYPVPDTAPLSGQIRIQPIDTRDIFTLPDGTSGPIIKVDGVVNAATHRPFMSEVWLGKS